MKIANVACLNVKKLNF